MALAPDIHGERRWTVADYMELDDDRRYEVIDGELWMVPSPNIFHQRAILKLGNAFDSHVSEHELGECFPAPFDVVLSEEDVVQPDFTFVRQGRLDNLYDEHCITGAPDMVVEVISPSTAAHDRVDKRRLYAASAIEWLLFVDPKAQVVEVFHLNDDGKYVLEETAAEDGHLQFGLFPDLSIPLEDVWFVPPEEESRED